MTSQAGNQQAEGRALARPHYELVPMRGVLKAADGLPADAAVSVTCSPTIGLDASLDIAIQLREKNLRITPHLAARRVRGRKHLTSILQRLSDAGIRDVFVVAGDNTDKYSVFESGLHLVRELRSLRADLDSIGVPCYPDGHPFIDTPTLHEMVRAKSFYADYMVSQMCFNADTILGWLRYTRAQSIELPLRIGIPGVLEPRRLVGIAMRLGLGNSTRFLLNNTGLISGLLGPSRYTPDALLDGLAAGMAAPELHIEGLHINTFNQVQATEAWRTGRLTHLAQDAKDSRAQVVQADGMHP